MTADGPLRVLVVEDEALILLATLDMLQELGHQPVRARNIAAALTAFEAEAPIDVLLTDINLPDGDGQSLAAEIRRRDPGMPVVFATGYRMKAPGGDAAAHTAILSKPYLTSELASALRRVTRNGVSP